VALPCGAFLRATKITDGRATLEIRGRSAYFGVGAGIQVANVENSPTDKSNNLLLAVQTANGLAYATGLVSIGSLLNDQQLVRPALYARVEAGAPGGSFHFGWVGGFAEFIVG
jgi:hypothetical protein